MAMENYNPPQDPWLVILYQDEHIMVGAEEAVRRPRLGPSAAGGRPRGFTADLRLAEPANAEGVL